MDQPPVPPHHPAIDMDDLAALVRIRAQLAHDLGIIAIGHEADVLAVRLQRYRQAQFRRNLAHLALGQPAQRKAQIIELRLSRGKQEVALVARRVGGAVQLCSCRALDPADIMARGQAIGP